MKPVWAGTSDFLVNGGNFDMKSGPAVKALLRLKSR
jgi:hypothetical protein